MSGQQAVTAAAQIGGAIIGAEFGVPTLGAAIGGVAGAFIGGALFNKDAPREDKPKIGDNRVQTSQFGGAVPIIFGRYRFAGNVIWCSDIRTIVTTQEVEPEGQQAGGKGGTPTQTVEQTEYKMDVAIAIGEGEIVEVEKMFANGVLIYDASVNAMPSGIYLREMWCDSIVVYKGTETQLPDPTLEAALGVGNVSAYRGTAYIVITNLNLTTLRTSTLPNFEFIAVRHGTTRRFHVKHDAIATYFHYYHSGGADGTPDTGFPLVRIHEGIIRISSLSPNDEFWDTGSVSAASGQQKKVELRALDGSFLGLADRDEFETAMPAWRIWDDGNPLPGVDLYYGVWQMADGTKIYATVSFGTSLEFQYWFGYPYLASGELAAALPLMAESPQPHMAYIPCADGHHGLVVLYRGSSGANQNGFYWYLVAWLGADSGFAIINEGPCGPNVNAWTNFNGVPHGSAYTACGAFLESDLRHVWSVNVNYNVHSYWIDDSNTLQWLAEYKNLSPGVPLYDVAQISQLGGSGVATCGIYADQGLCVVVVDKMLSIYSRDVEVITAEVPLSAVVEELCVRSGIPSSEIDATDLDAGESPAPISTTVYGFMVGKSMTARAAIEALRPGYFFDVVDGDKLKFIRRGAQASVTFQNEDLGAGQDEAGVSEVQSAFEQPTELPARVNIRYVSIDGDLQWGTQTARRETTTSVEVLDGEVPCVFTDAHAWTIAENNLRDIWASAGKRKFSTGLKYAKHEPTDVVFLDDGSEVRQVRIVRRADFGSMIEWEAEDIDALMYASRSTLLEFSIPSPSQPLGPGTPVEVESLDLPPLTELKSGNEVGVYVAASPLGSAPRWSGAHVLVSRDSGVSFEGTTFVSLPSAMGMTLSALRSFTGGNIFDTTSRIRVFLNYGSLSTATESEVLNGANAAIVGNEIVQFCGVTQISANVFELTRFLRGRKGTEWAVSGHPDSERFIVLSTRLRDLPLDIGDRFSDKMFLRAFGSGSAVRFGTTERFETQFARLMPYSPVHLFAVRHPSGDWTLRWNRRDRYMNDWNSGVDVPLSEADEIYEVEVYNSGGTLVQTYTGVTAPTLTVPDSVLGGSPTPTSITFKVYQMSEIVGRGFVGSKTITQAL